MIDESKYVDEMRDLFLTRGWEWIQLECEDAIDVYSDMDAIHTAEQLWMAKGVRLMAAQILNLPANVESIEAEAALEGLLHEDAY